MDFAILNAQRDFAWGRGSAATQTNKQLKFLCKKSPFSPFKTLVVALYAFFKRSRSFIKPSIKRLIIVIRKRPSDLGEFTVYKAHKHYRMIFLGSSAHLLLAQKLPSRKNYVFAKVHRRNFIAICIIIHPRLHSTIVGDIGLIPGWIYPYLPIFLLELEILQVPTLTSTSSSLMYQHILSFQSSFKYIRKQAKLILANSSG